jgi:hypothetical protein
VWFRALESVPATASLALRPFWSAAGLS